MAVTVITGIEVAAVNTTVATPVAAAVVDKLDGSFILQLLRIPIILSADEMIAHKHTQKKMEKKINQFRMFFFCCGRKNKIDDILPIEIAKQTTTVGKLDEMAISFSTTIATLKKNKQKS